MISVNLADLNINLKQIMENSKVTKILSLIQEEFWATSRLKELRNLLKTESIRVTLWSNNGAIDNCENLINQDEIKNRAEKEVAKITNDLSNIQKKINKFKNK